MIIKYDLLPKQRPRKRSLKVKVDLFPLATELYEELDCLGIIERLKQVKQLGLIDVPKKLEKTRYDYVLLQLYFHQLIRTKIKNELKLSYSNKLTLEDLLKNHDMTEKDIGNKKEVIVTQADVMQILAIAYNAGHFHNTFASSRAVILLAKREPSFYEQVVNSSDDKRYQYAAKKVLDNHNYQRIHLLNSLLILEKCDQSKRAVRIARELIMSYLLEDELSGKSKLHEYFKLFRHVRMVSFVAYDLQIAKVPFILDLGNVEGLQYFFRELLAEYNDNRPSKTLMKEMAKLLDASVYNDADNTICLTQIAERMADRLTTDQDWKDYYTHYWHNENSVLNARYTKKHDYDEGEYLKLTFQPEKRVFAEELYEELNRQNNTRVGYYLRHTGEMTIVLAISKKCDRKVNIAFKVLKTVVAYGRKMRLSVDDANYIVATKYFLHYLFGERCVIINPVVHKTKCVICTKGKNARIVELKRTLVGGNEDERHEVEEMMSFLRNDQTNDTTITISGSTVVYDTENEAKTIAEFDGIIIYPNRADQQVVLLEMKNMKQQVGFAKKCLGKKFDILGMPYKPNDIQTLKRDAYYVFTL